MRTLVHVSCLLLAACGPADIHEFSQGTGESSGADPFDLAGFEETGAADEGDSGSREPDAGPMHQAPPDAAEEDDCCTCLVIPTTNAMYGECFPASDMCKSTVPGGCSTYEGSDTVLVALGALTCDFEC